MANANSLSDCASEEMIISALLNAKTEDIEYIFDALKAGDFYYEGNRSLYSLLLGIYANERKLSLVSIMKLYAKQIEQIKTRKSLIEMNMLYVTYTMGEDYGENNRRDIIESSVKSIKKKAEYRAIANLIAKVQTDIQNDVSPDEIYQSVEKAMLAREPLSDKRSYLSPREMGELMLSTVLERMDKDKRKKEVAFTSFRQINRRTGGFEKGDLIILSAASGVGKSALAMNITRDVAYVGQKIALYLNSEMSNPQQALRFASMLTQYSHSELRNGLNPDWSQKAISDVSEKAQEYMTKQIHILNIPDLQLSNVVSEVRRMVNRYGVEFVVVDYVGRMDTMNLKDNRAEWQVMEQAARTLKTMAQELNIVVMMVAQMSSNGQSLAKGSSMKNEADLWMNISRVDHEESIEKFGAEDGIYWNTTLEIRKARNVESGAVIPMHFHGDTLTYTDDIEKAKEFVALEEEPYDGI